LELMLAKEDWSGQDFSATIASISAGGAYSAV